MPRELEERLATPGRHVEQRRAAGREDAPDLRERLLRLPHVLEDRQAEDGVQRRALDRGQGVGQRALDGLHARMALEIVGQREIDEER